MDRTKATFVKLIQKHSGIINSLCRVYFSKKQDYEDARQDIILQLWIAYPSFRAESKWSTWIYRVSLNTILKKIRKEKKQGVLESLDKLYNTSNPQVYPSDDDLQLLLQFIDVLNSLDKAIIILYLEGYPNWEIADLLDLTASNVSTRLNRIKNKFQKMVKALKHDLN